MQHPLSPVCAFFRFFDTRKPKSATITITTMRDRGREDGFTVVEVLVTLVLAMLFLVFFIQMFQAISVQQISTTRQSVANDIAYSNLSKFPTLDSIDDVGPAYTCGSSNDLSSNPNAAGTVILDNDDNYRETELRGLPDVTQEVRAYSPLGCSSPLVKIESAVYFGFSAQRGESIYATYIKD